MDSLVLDILKEKYPAGEFYVNQFGNNILIDCLHGLTIKDELRSSLPGLVLVRCLENNCEYILKLSTSDKELRILKQLNNSRLTPKLLDSWKCEIYNADTKEFTPVNVMLMEKYEGTLSSLVSNFELPN
jgi:hypothetical protein